MGAIVGMILMVGILSNLWGFANSYDGGGESLWICLNLWLMLLVGIAIWG